MKFIAYCTKGLEDIASKEIIRVLKGSTILKLGTKRIIFEYEGEFDTISNLRTVDDISIFVEKIDLAKAHFLDSVVNVLGDINYNDYIELIKNYREINEREFSLTISVIHYKKFPRDTIKNALAKKISENYKLKYLPKDHTNFDIRINIESNIAWIGIKLTPQSLFDRSYKINDRMGSLKPTIAAAMVDIAVGNQKDLKIVDNYCGSGAILCEAFLKGNDVFGGDIHEAAVRSSIENLQNLEFKNIENIRVQDASETNWESKYFDCAISNLPWDKQIPVESITELYENCIKEYKRIVKMNGKICLILSKPELMEIIIDKHFPNAKIRSYPIGFLGQRPTILLINL